jgi:hypothetical protein
MNLSAWPFCQGERAAVGRSRIPIANTRRTKASPYAVAITDEISWRLLPAERFSQLLRDPMGVRMGGHAQPQQLSTATL